MASETIGRDEEVERLRAFFDATDVEGPRALVLEGEAGIGKSTLWLRGLDLGRERGLCVLSSRPAEAEQALAFAGVSDLLEGALDHVIPALPPPRRHALEVALLLEAAQDPVEPRALGVAVRSAVELLAEKQPVLIAIDDVQWLDGPSADSLAFALRRTRAPVRVLLARRRGDAAEGPASELALPDGALEHLRIGPLSAGALMTVIRDRLDRAFPRPTLLGIHEMSGGNPFYALEIARALPDPVDPSGPLAVPKTLEELVRARIDALPRRSRDALVLLAAMGEADTETLRRAGAEDALGSAVSNGVVERVRDRWRFTHPLLASCVYQGTTDEIRRSCHATLAKLVRDPLQSARHLALAANGTDATVAASLDEAAALARVRGAPNVAAELAELARRLTPDADYEASHRRAILVATAHLRAGDVPRARARAEATLAQASRDRSRAEALVLQSAVEATAGNLELAIELRRSALAESTHYPALQAAVHQWLAANVPYSEGIRVKEAHARTAVECAQLAGDDFLYAGALAVLAVLRQMSGKPDALEIAEQAHALTTSRASRADGAHRDTDIAHALAWTYDRLDLVAGFVLVDILITLRHFERARALLDELELELARSDELLEAKVLWVRSVLEIDAGRWDLAESLASREREIDVLYERAVWPGPFVSGAELALHRGDVARARELAVHARELDVVRLGADVANVEAAFGLVNRAAGDPAAAVASFTAAEAAADSSGWREPSLLWWRAEFAESLLDIGDVEAAVAVLDAWEPEARRLGRDWIVAYVTRCRGLVAAARGEVELALATLEQAVELADAVGDAFGRARAHLALGIVRRRARQKRGAREATEAAIAGFEELGEVPWAQKARSELVRIGGRTREEGLTPAERRVAALVADGRTNREVAAALFLGERTVETHLTRIYAKLGIRSRTELARTYEAAP